MDDIVILKKEELKEMLKEVIQEKPQEKQETEEKQYLGVSECLDYLAKKGIKMRKSTLYKHTMNETIPFRKFGKNIVFSPADLDEWIEERLNN